MARLLVPGLTAGLMILVGLFWMFVWLLGANGYNSAQSGEILGLNFVLVLVAIGASSFFSDWSARALAARTQWSPIFISLVSIVCAALLAVIALFVGSVIILLVVGQSR